MWAIIVCDFYHRERPLNNFSGKTAVSCSIGEEDIKSHSKVHVKTTISYIYYTTSSASGQDEPNLALWLATQAGKMDLSCPLGIQVMSRNEHLSYYGVLSRTINPLLTKLVRSKWLDIGLVLFLRVYGPRRSLGP